MKSPGKFAPELQSNLEEISLIVDSIIPIDIIVPDNKKELISKIESD